MQKRMLVMFKRKWDFENDRNERVKGQAIQAFDGIKVTVEGQTGVVAPDISVEEEVFDQIHTVPGIYDFEVESVLVRKGTKLAYISASFVREFNLRQILSDDFQMPKVANTVLNGASAPAPAAAGAGR